MFWEYLQIYSKLKINTTETTPAPGTQFIILTWAPIDGFGIHVGNDDVVQLHHFIKHGFGARCAFVVSDKHEPHEKPTILVVDVRAMSEY